MTDSNDSRMVRLPVREMRDEPAPQRAAQEGDLPPLLTDERIHEIVREAAKGSALRPIRRTPTSVRIARAIESEVRTAIAAAGGGVPPGYKLVPIEFLRGFLTLAHNYSLRAEPPDFYRGVEGDAFSNAYRRCGEDLAKLRAMLASSPQPEAAPAVAQVPQDDKSDGPLLDGQGWTITLANGHAGPGWYAHCEDYPEEGAVFIAAAPEAPAQLNPAYRIAPVDPTLEMIDAGAQRLVSWGENSTWPDSWDALQVEAARTEADRCYRSMILVAPGPEAPAQAAKWIDDPHDIEQGQMLNPEWLKAHGLTAAEASQPTQPEAPEEIVRYAKAMQKDGYRGPLTWASAIIDWVAALSHKEQP